MKTREILWPFSKFKNKNNLSKSNKKLRDVIYKRTIYDNKVTIKKLSWKTYKT